MPGTSYQRKSFIYRIRNMYKTLYTSMNQTQLGGMCSPLCCTVVLILQIHHVSALLLGAVRRQRRPVGARPCSPLCCVVLFFRSASSLDCSLAQSSLNSRLERWRSQIHPDTDQRARLPLPTSALRQRTKHTPSGFYISCKNDP